MAKELDLSNHSLEELVDIHNQVLRRVAVEAKLRQSNVAASEPHDSHSSNHSNNKIVDRQALQQLGDLRK